MRRLWLLIALSVVGCGAPDAVWGRLSTGQTVIFLIQRPRAKKPMEKAFVFVPEGREGRDLEGIEVVEVAAGTRAVVLSDKQLDEPNAKSAKRWVQVKIDEGPKAGTVGEARRVWLRPSR